MELLPAPFDPLMFGDDSDEANLGVTVREGAAGGRNQEAGGLTPCTPGLPVALTQQGVSLFGRGSEATG